jgi:hypothetical protein
MLWLVLALERNQSPSYSEEVAIPSSGILPSSKQSCILLKE